MNLLDALSSNTTARSVVELSLNPNFGRGYGSLYDGIKNYDWKDEGGRYIEVGGEQVWYNQSKILLHVFYGVIPEPLERGYRLIGLDGTPMPRLYSKTLKNRSYVYQPTAVPGAKPVTVGYKSSSVVYFPEREGETKWVVPLMMERIDVEKDETERSKGVEQLDALLSDPKLSFGTDLVVAVNDSNYSQVPFLHPLLSTYDNLVNISRSGGNRVFYSTSRG